MLRGIWMKLLTNSEKYAIRPTIRTHKILQRDAVIKQVAAMVGDSHKVNLTKPDKVILVEIYQVRWTHITVLLHSYADVCRLNRKLTFSFSRRCAA